MIVETELKLHVSPEHLQKLKRHPLLRSLSTDRARTQKLYSIYYDTADLDLREHAMALRLRRVGKQWTIRGMGGFYLCGLFLVCDSEGDCKGTQRFDIGFASSRAKLLAVGGDESAQPRYLLEDLHTLLSQGAKAIHKDSTECDA